MYSATASISGGVRKPSFWCCASRSAASTAERRRSARELREPAVDLVPRVLAEARRCHVGAAHRSISPNTMSMRADHRDDVREHVAAHQLVHRGQMREARARGT